MHQQNITHDFISDEKKKENNEYIKTKIKKQVCISMFLHFYLLMGME